MFFRPLILVCPECSGEGRIWGRICPSCHGTGKYYEGKERTSEFAGFGEKDRTPFYESWMDDDD